MTIDETLDESIKKFEQWTCVQVGLCPLCRKPTKTIDGYHYCFDCQWRGATMTNDERQARALAILAALTEDFEYYELFEMLRRLQRDEHLASRKEREPCES